MVNAERYRGFANLLVRASFTCHLLPPADTRHSPPATQDWTTRRKVLTRELRHLPKPLAAFGYNDCVAADIIDACDGASLLVPEVVAVMGGDKTLSMKCP